MVAFGAATISAGAAPPIPDLVSLPDGEWIGRLVYDGRISFPSDVYATGTAAGAFMMTIEGGAITRGSATFSGSSNASTDTGTADAAFFGTGTMRGDALNPVLQITVLNFSGTAEAQGVLVPFDLTFEEAEITPVQLLPLAITCEMASGEFTQSLLDVVTAAGGTAGLYGYWIATRSPGGDDSAVEAAARSGLDLLELRDQITDGVDPGPVHVSRLTLDVMDQLAAAEANEFCRELYPGAAEGFAVSTVAIVRQVIDAALANARTLSTATLRALVNLAVVSGLLHGSAPDEVREDEVRNPELRNQLRAVFTERYRSALGPPVATDEMHQVLLAALTMGWGDLESDVRWALT